MPVAELEKLILCAGPYYYPGYKTLDANPAYHPDYCTTLPPLPRELRNGQWSEIFLIHGIEHFYLWDAKELLRNCHEALAPGGLLVLEQPNLEVCAKVLLGIVPPMTTTPEASGINGIYGDPWSENPLMCHRWGWTPTTLTEAVREAGFENVKVGKAVSRPFAEGRDFRIEATK